MSASTLGPVLGDGGLDLGDLLADLLQLLLCGVVLLRGGVEALLVRRQLGGDLRCLSLRARQGVGRRRARRDAENT